MNSIPIDLHLEAEREPTHIESTLRIEQGMCVTYLISDSERHKIQIELYRPALRELIRQLSQTLGATP